MENYYLQILNQRDLIEKTQFEQIIKDYYKLAQQYQALQKELASLKHLTVLDKYSTNSNTQNEDKERSLIRDLNEQLKQNQEQSQEVVNLSKQVKQYEHEIADLNKQLVKQIQAKLQSQKAMENSLLALSEINEKFSVMSQEYHAIKETNIFLEKKVRVLTGDNQLFLTQLMELKDKQIDKLDQANEIYKEVEYMREQLKFFKHSSEVVSKLHEIMKAEPELRQELLKTATTIRVVAKDNGSDGVAQEEEEKEFDFTKQVQKRGVSQMIPKSMFITGNFNRISAPITQESESQVATQGGSPFETYSIYSDSVPTRVEVRQHAHEKETTCLRFSTSGSLLATGGADNIIKIWDVNQSCDCVQTFKIFSKPISTLAFGKDGEIVIGCSVDRQIKICSLRPHKVAHQLSGHSENINCCGFCYSLPYAFTGSSDRTIKVWDYVNGNSIGAMGCASGVYSLDISISDSICSSGHRDGTLRIWSIRDQKLLQEVKGLHEDVITSVNYLPDGSQILTNSRDHSLKLIDVRTFKTIKTIENENYYNSNDTNQIGISPSGKYAAVGSKNGKLLIINIEEGEVEEIYDKEHTTSIVSCDWSKRGSSKVATIDSIGNLFIWD